MTFMNLSTVEPFEISSIRPPTENDSLTFRLTRNCGWNRCQRPWGRATATNQNGLRKS